MPNKVYYERNKKRLLAEAKVYYKNNKDRINKRNDEWAKRNPEKKKAIVNKSRKKRQPSVNAKHREYLKAHPEKLAGYRKQSSDWKKKNRNRCRALENKRRTAKTSAGGAYTSAQWIALCNKCHNRCLCCGKKRKLTADHVVPVSKGGSSDISNIQPLCGPCNSSKKDKTVDYR